MLACVCGAAVAGFGASLPVAATAYGTSTTTGTTTTGTTTTNTTTTNTTTTSTTTTTTPPPPTPTWFPHPKNAKWSFKWSDPTYNPSGTIEAVKVAAQAAANGCGWQLSWTGDTKIPLGTSTSGGTVPVIDSPDNGTICFIDQSYGLENTDWSSTPPPINEPPLCSSTSQCPNSLGSTLYDVIWGSRAPLLSEPLLQGTTWNATGGGDGSVTSLNRYLGEQLVKVPAFPNRVKAAAVRSEIALAGTPGDDFGSGVRTTWWAYGIGPVKVTFDHVDGSTTSAELQSTNLKPVAPPPDTDYFPLNVGLKNTYRWTNARHLRKPEVETVSIAAASNRSARFDVKSLSGPIRAAASYLFSMRLDGLRNTWASTSGATLLKLPRLGHGRHFFTPLDLMTFGFNPVLPAYPVIGTRWTSGNARDMEVFGVRGSTKVIGVRTVHVPAGTFRALLVKSTLKQKGFRYGSGERSMWFAPRRGLVKLVFKHRDGSTSLVQLIR